MGCRGRRRGQGRPPGRHGAPPTEPLQTEPGRDVGAPTTARTPARHGYFGARKPASARRQNGRGVSRRNPSGNGPSGQHHAIVRSRDGAALKACTGERPGERDHFRMGFGVLPSPPSLLTRCAYLEPRQARPWQPQEAPRAPDVDPFRAGQRCNLVCPSFWFWNLDYYFFNFSDVLQKSFSTKNYLFYLIQNPSRLAG